MVAGTCLPNDWLSDGLLIGSFLETAVEDDDVRLLLARAREMEVWVEVSVPADGIEHGRRLTGSFWVTDATTDPLITLKEEFTTTANTLVTEVNATKAQVDKNKDLLDRLADPQNLAAEIAAAVIGLAVSAFFFDRLNYLGTFGLLFLGGVCFFGLALSDALSDLGAVLCGTATIVVMGSLVLLVLEARVRPRQGIVWGLGLWRRSWVRVVVDWERWELLLREDVRRERARSVGQSLEDVYRVIEDDSKPAAVRGPEEQD